MTNHPSRAGAYVLGELSVDEANAFEVHLDVCEDCRREVADLGEGLTRGAPMDRAWRIADQSDRRRPRRFRLAIATLAALLLIGGLVAALLPDRADRILGADGAVTLAIPATEAYPADGAARLVYVPGSGEAVLVLNGLIEPPDGAVYGAWLIGPGGPQPAGLFTPESDGTATVVLEVAYQPGDAVGVTLEPAGGSPFPTGTILFVGV